MRIAAGLCFYDEPPELLEQCVRSLAGFVDHLVALDGPWDLWPHADPEHDQAEQHDAVERAAREAGVTVELVAGRWATQVEKRSDAIQRAAAAADWVMPLDSDWVLAGDPARMRRELERTSRDTGMVRFHTPRGASTEGFHDWHVKTMGTTKRYHLLYRALEGIRVEGFHWWYSAIKDGRRVALWGCRRKYPQARTFPVSGVRVTHRCFDRSRARAEANRDYVLERSRVVASTGAEG